MGRGGVPAGARRPGLACAFVSNGNATPEALDFLRPWIVAYKIDLKSFDDRHYRTLGGTLEHVTEGIRMVHERGFWLEVVTLLVPGFNDSEAELRELARFLGLRQPGHPVARDRVSSGLQNDRPAGHDVAGS